MSSTAGIRTRQFMVHNGGREHFPRSRTRGAPRGWGWKTGAYQKKFKSGLRSMSVRSTMPHSGKAPVFHPIEGLAAATHRQRRSTRSPGVTLLLGGSADLWPRPRPT